MTATWDSVLYAPNISRNIERVENDISIKSVMANRYLHMCEISLLRLSVFRSNEKVMRFYSHSVFNSLLFNKKKKKKKELFIILVV